MQEQLKMIRLLFKRLRVIYEKCTESLQLQGMEYMHIEVLYQIPPSGVGSRIFTRSFLSTTNKPLPRFYWDFHSVLNFQSLIPLKEEWDMKSEEKKTSEQYRVACDESKEVMEVRICFNCQ